MGEGQVTVDGVTHQLSKPFLVMATQNPVEFEGTFPLPEAQLDRFFIRLDIGYPSLDDERAILDSQKLSHPIDSLTQVTNAESLIECQNAIGEVHVERSVEDYVLAVVRGTRRAPRRGFGSVSSRVVGTVPAVAVNGRGARPELRVARRREAPGPLRLGTPDHHEA